LDHKIIDLYDEYTHGGMDRRDFLDRLAQLAGGAAAALALLAALQNSYAQAQIIAENDDRLAISRVEYDAAGTKIAGYLARLKGGAKHPGVIVIHENRGLNPHIQDVARRIATEGFLALAPDMLSPLGGTPSEEDKATKMIGSLNAEETVARLAAAVPFLANHAESAGKVGVVGFCWGGGMVNRLAAARRTLLQKYGLTERDASKLETRSLSITASTPTRRSRLKTTGMPPPPQAITSASLASAAWMAGSSMISFGPGDGTTRR
jgi:carboxymethylenebutenolidase